MKCLNYLSNNVYLLFVYFLKGLFQEKAVLQCMLYLQIITYLEHFIHVVGQARLLSTSFRL